MNGLFYTILFLKKNNNNKKTKLGFVWVRPFIELFFLWILEPP